MSHFSSIGPLPFSTSGVMLPGRESEGVSRETLILRTGAKLTAMALPRQLRLPLVVTDTQRN